MIFTAYSGHELLVFSLIMCLAYFTRLKAP
jgi:hypothetical protein